MYFCFPNWVPAVVALLSSPPSGRVRRASGVASCRLVVAAPVSESGAVNYSSKRRSHTAPRDVEVSKSNIISHIRPEHRSPVSMTKLPGPPCEEVASSSPSPAESDGWSPSVVLYVEECVRLLLQLRGKQDATTGGKLGSATARSRSSSRCRLLLTGELILT